VSSNTPIKIFETMTHSHKHYYESYALRRGTNAIFINFLRSAIRALARQEIVEFISDIGVFAFRNLEQQNMSQFYCAASAF
jgi:hypothetical protein